MRQNELNVHETLRKAQLKNMRHVYSELSNTKSLIDDAIESKFLINDESYCKYVWLKGSPGSRFSLDLSSHIAMYIYI